MLQECIVPDDLYPRYTIHYGIPFTSSIMAFDPIQKLLAIGTLDGRIKVIGGNNIEGLLVSPKQLPYKNIEFLCNQGFLVGVSNENDIEVWDLIGRRVVCCLHWKSNITTFSVVDATHFMYIGDEYGLFSVLKYDSENEILVLLPYQVPSALVGETVGVSLSSNLSIVGILSPPSASGSRVLIAYENGLLVLWDVSNAKPVLVRGYTSLQPAGESSNDLANDFLNHLPYPEKEDKEICCICWASPCGSVLAVGYIDGDILIWNVSSSSDDKCNMSSKVVKMQLSSAERRLPVIVVRWSPGGRPTKDHGGYLFIYGGDEVGSEETITILSVQWSAGLELLTCLARVNLTLAGPFADMILMPDCGSTRSCSSIVFFVLTNPGQLLVYDDASLSSIIASQQKGKHSVRLEQFHVIVPTTDPYMTKSRLIVPSVSCIKLLSEMASTMKASNSLVCGAEGKWPLTGGVLSTVSHDKNIGVERLFMGGYHDGSVRIWDATTPVLSLMCLLEVQLPGMKIGNEGAPVSSLDVCSMTMTIAVGNESGLVCVYMLYQNPGEMTFHFMDGAKHLVHRVHHKEGFSCSVALLVQTSPVRALHFVDSGHKLIVGFECCQVALFDTRILSILFMVDCSIPLNSPVISVLPSESMHTSTPTIDSVKVHSSWGDWEGQDVLFILSSDSHIVTIDGMNGQIISSHQLSSGKESNAVSMYIIDSPSHDDSSSEGSIQKDVQDMTLGTAKQPFQPPAVDSIGHASQEIEVQLEIRCPLFLLCFQDAVHLYALESIIKGECHLHNKVHLARNCCWSSFLKTNDSKKCGLILFYQPGILEIRSLPDLEVVMEVSLLSILRWNFKTEMACVISSLNNGQIALVRGSELAFISVLVGENDLRIPNSLPCLHDNAVAAATELSLCQDKKKNLGPGILGGIIKGLKGHTISDNSHKVMVQNMEEVFSRPSFRGSYATVKHDQDAADLSIDDIEIDDTSASSRGVGHGKRDKQAKKQLLFHEPVKNVMPKLRTPQEIKAHYRKTENISMMMEAREKLVKRQEKLERIGRNAEELQSGAESFASMASELAKTMETRKWW